MPRKPWEAIPLEERRKRRQLVPYDTFMTLASFSIPGPDREWLETEANRRDIALSWIAVEIIKLGIETYKLMTDIPETFMGVPFEKGAKRGQGG